MKLGFGLYRHMLTPANLKFAKQVGAAHLAIHLVDYFNKGDTTRRDTPAWPLRWAI
jgi:mannonate dehydratase